MNSEPCVRFGMRISPKISEKPADNRNSSPPNVTLLTDSTSQKFIAKFFLKAGVWYGCAANSVHLAPLAGRGRPSEARSGEGVSSKPSPPPSPHRRGEGACAACCCRFNHIKSTQPLSGG